MSKSQWKDTTSYSRGQRGNTQPRAWTLRLPWVVIHVHRHINWPPDQWLCSCVQACVYCYELESKDITEAKEEAVRYVRESLGNAIKAIDDYLGDAK